MCLSHTLTHAITGPSGVEGVDYVLHTASPFKMSCVDGQREMVDPALLGTENVINSALKVDSIKRIVVTSSAAAILNESIVRSKRLILACLLA